jgi:two-component system CheB/CheR fusion protein
VIRQGALHLTPRETGSFLRSIDQFFRSLAQDRGDAAIGVVLSGTATDGTLGLRAIKAEGGITFAQDDTAQQTSMPHSAIAQGAVDFVMPPADIARELVRIARHPQMSRGATRPGTDGPNALRQVLRTVQQRTGVDFSGYKATTLGRRVSRRIILRKASGLADYAQLLQSTPEEVEALHDDLLIGVTSFFRDPDAFEYLKAAVFPRLVSADRAHDPMRIWVLGCSTGQEVYSVAIAFTEFVERSAIRVPVQIFASDVSATAIETARSGIYPKEIVQDVSPERLRRFFTPVDGRYQISKSIRDM